MTTVLCVFFSMLAVGVSSGIHLAACSVGDPLPVRTQVRQPDSAP